MKILIIVCILFIATGCATTRDKARNVDVIKLTKYYTEYIEVVDGLEERNCKFVKRVEATIDYGPGKQSDKLRKSLKKATVKAGGNTVVTRLEAHPGFLTYTKGKVYRCPSRAIASKQ